MFHCQMVNMSNGDNIFHQIHGISIVMFDVLQAITIKKCNECIKRAFSSDYNVAFLPSSTNITF